MEATGGTLPHTFAKSSGFLPYWSGLFLSCNGNITGTPWRTLSYDFTVRVTDASGRTAEKTFHLEIIDPLIISTLKLNNGIVGAPYNQTLSASGGYGAHLWAVYSGTLPAGLSLNTETGALSGTPTEATYGTVVFSVSDEEGRITYKDLTLQIADPLQILTISLPNGLR
ncbi:MAG: Ig domain-containing protein, partial [Thermodesulfobacteriota bacterium]|nr:Ig domain-containing protein [Thermodesulfobacteriota bacterium]